MMATKVSDSQGGVVHCVLGQEDGLHTAFTLVSIWARTLRFFAKGPTINHEGVLVTGSFVHRLRKGTAGQAFPPQHSGRVGRAGASLGLTEESGVWVQMYVGSQADD